MRAFRQPLAADDGDNDAVPTGVGTVELDDIDDPDDSMDDEGVDPPSFSENEGYIFDSVDLDLQHGIAAAIGIVPEGDIAAAATTEGIEAEAGTHEHDDMVVLVDSESESGVDMIAPKVEPESLPGLEGESVVEEPRAKKARAAVAPAASSSSVPRKKVHRSPKEILQPLSPPGCTLALAFNDYRFTASWKRHIRCDFWIDELSNFSFSSVFTKESWKESLRIVHAHSWEKWSIARDVVPELTLPDGRQEQNPGVIADSVFAELDPIVRDIPPPKRYPKKK